MRYLIGSALTVCLSTGVFPLESWADSRKLSMANLMRGVDVDEYALWSVDCTQFREFDDNRFDLIDGFATIRIPIGFPIDLTKSIGPALPMISGQDFLQRKVPLWKVVYAKCHANEMLDANNKSGDSVVDSRTERLSIERAAQIICGEYIGKGDRSSAALQAFVESTRTRAKKALSDASLDGAVVDQDPPYNSMLVRHLASRISAEHTCSTDSIARGIDWVNDYFRDARRGSGACAGYDKTIQNVYVHGGGGAPAIDFHPRSGRNCASNVFIDDYNGIGFSVH